MVLVAIVGAVSTVVFHPVIGLPIASIGLASLVYARKTLAATATVVVGTVLTTGLARTTLYVVVFPLVGVPITARAPYVFAALVLASLLVAGPLAASLMRRRTGLQTVVVVAGLLSGAQVAALAAFGAGAGMGVGEYIAAVVDGLVTRLGLAGEMAESVLAMWPGAMVSINAASAVLVVVCIGAVAAKRGVAVRGIPALAAVDLDPRLVIMPIAAIGLIALGRLPLDAARSLGNVGMNLLVVARWVFFIQGIAVFAGLYERAKFARPVRAFGFALLGVVEALIPAVSLMGLVDIWLNVRRLPREGAKAERV